MQNNRIQWTIFIWPLSATATKCTKPFWMHIQPPPCLLVTLLFCPSTKPKQKYQFSIKIYMPHAENGETKCRNELWSTNKYNLARAQRAFAPFPLPYTSSTLFQSIRYAIYHFGFGLYFRSTSHIKIQCFGQCKKVMHLEIKARNVCAPVFLHASFFWSE